MLVCTTVTFTSLICGGVMTNFGPTTSLDDLKCSDSVPDQNFHIYNDPDPDLAPFIISISSTRITFIRFFTGLKVVCTERSRL